MPALESKVPYKWDDWTMLSLIELNPYVCFVKGDSPYRSLRAIDAIRANPGKLNFSTAGVGTSQNMAAQYLMTLAGLTKDHGRHPLQGRRRGDDAVLGEQVQFACNNAPTVIPQVRAGALRALFVVTPGPPRRAAGRPDARARPAIRTWEKSSAGRR